MSRSPLPFDPVAEAVAAAVRAGNGSLVGSVAVSAPDARLATDAERLSELFSEHWGTADPPGDPAAHRSTNRAWSGPTHD